MSARRWCFTKFLEEEDQQGLDGWIQNIRQDPRVRGVAGQMEKCPTTGRLHLQGYVELTGPQRLAGMKKLFGQEVHLEAAKGTRGQNVKYVNKELVNYCLPFIFFN